MEFLTSKLAFYLYYFHNIRRDDAVALYMENRPEFICWWLAISRLGAKVALLNHSVKSKGLVHCIKEAKV